MRVHGSVLALCMLCVLFVDPVFGGQFTKLYEALDVQTTASQSDIKKSFRRLSLQYHPDKSGGAKDAEEKFRLISEAYRILSDEESRKAYDLYGDDDFDNILEFHKIIKMNGAEELYQKKPGVKILFHKNIDNSLTQSNYTWLVTFYHPHCGGCQQAVPELSRAAEIASTNKKYKNIKVGVINCMVEMGTCHRFGVDNLGSVFVYPPGQIGGGFFEKEPYHGKKEAAAMLKFAKTIPMSLAVNVKNLEEIRTLMRKAPASSESKGPIEQLWIVDFFKPGCPPCLQIATSLRQLTTELKGVAKFATINCHENPCGNIPYFPYLQMWTKRRGSPAIEVANINYDVQFSHPGVLAMKILGGVMREVVGLQWTSEEETKKKDEL